MGRTVIKGGTLVSTGGTLRADLVIEGEKVAGTAASDDPRPGDEVIDAAGLLVLPGIVDAHTHIQLDTGIYRTADNWEIGTKAAAAGGVTTVIDFATQFPGQTVDEALDNRLKETAPAIIDYGLHCMITDLPYGREEASLNGACPVLRSTPRTGPTTTWATRRSCGWQRRRAAWVGSWSCTPRTTTS
jgi:dihydropyrimidinase